MKKITACLILSFLLLALGCNKKDEHSLGEFRIDIATVIKENNYIYSILLDNGKRLWPAASDIHYIPENNQRVFINYTTLSGEKNGFDHFIKINDIWNILTKEIVDLSSANEWDIGNDPLRINETWIGSNYLNIDFMFNYGGERPHSINLVKNPDNFISSDGSINLELRHNSFESQSSRLLEGLVSFNIKSLQLSNVDSVKINLHVKDFAEDKVYHLIYRYNGVTSPTQFVETPVLVVSTNEYY